MSDKSKIEWTDATWNPIRGCSRVSEGCRNCYAERIAARFAGPGQPYEDVAFPSGGRGVDVKIESLAKGGGSKGWTGDVRFIPELLNQPLRWKRPRKIFVNSMSDLFHEKIAGLGIGYIFGIMAMCPQHTFQILTKRAERMQIISAATCNRERLEQMMQSDLVKYLPGGRTFPRTIPTWPLPNVWLGVSVEDQKTADERIPLLLQTPAAVRWVSYEPALGPVDFSAIRRTRAEGFMRPLDGRFNKLDWIVAGGESGPGTRPSHPGWFRAVRAQCQSAGVPFFFKQWGEWLHASQMNGAFTNAELDALTFKTVCRDTGKGDLYFRVGKKRAGHLLDGEVWRQFPAGGGR